MPNPAGSEPSVSADWQVLEGLDPDTAEFPRSPASATREFWCFASARLPRHRTKLPASAASLHDAFLQASDTMLRCRWHNYVFRLRDGKGINCPGYKLKVFEVKRDNNMLLRAPSRKASIWSPCRSEAEPVSTSRRMSSAPRR